MSIVNPSQSNAGDLITAAAINTPVNQISAVVNGGLDNTNLADGGVTTVKIADGNITAAKLSSSAITLGYAQITSDFSSTNTFDTDVTGLSTAVTIPAGGRRIKITAYCRNFSGNGLVQVLIKNAGGTALGTAVGNPAGQGVIAMAMDTPSAGSQTYKVAISQSSAGTMVYRGTAWILVEAI